MCDVRASSMQCDAQARTSVTQVTAADDLDIGPNSEIRYRVSPCMLYINVASSLFSVEINFSL